MDFNDTPEQAAFRKSAADWLAANVPSKEEIKGMSRLEFAKMWQKRKYDAGWACIGWDPAYGGRGASTIEQVIWKQEEGARNSCSRMFSGNSSSPILFLLSCSQAVRPSAVRSKKPPVL